ncbi:gamma carbonic anhydrase family protein [Isoptericola variabilis]|uniref:Transferase hexapeptide protein n=1 Tax=Isoptericola variabilis (strain 225) TaxID=743718 RepID=F6FPL2_ISOV2|nr:gamma carbonic anhydrase family protein [Isoptericola variabilis]AEG44744.1 transferase hexapeptide protein [Isoptericola variabilis 225]TWH32357.1 carbonic anhydrase/acetyltransferase-like protein (isoleucine patch superfamily) [Isoptericola variabilis J7]
MATVLPFDGHTPEIDPTAWVAPTATLVGRVRVGPHASVFYGAVLRGDMDEITLGEGSNVQDNCVVHTDEGVPTRIGAGVGVGHGAIVHGATVEDGCLVGMGATLLNGSIVRTGAFVAAGALVREGQEIPAGHLAAGVPATVRGELDAAMAARVAENAVAYRRLAARHRDSVG